MRRPRPVRANTVCDNAVRANAEDIGGMVRYSLLNNKKEIDPFDETDKERVQSSKSYLVITVRFWKLSSYVKKT